MGTPITSEAWARQLVNNNFEDIFRWAKEDFFSSIPDEACDDPTEELLDRWNALVESYYERAVQATKRRIEDAVYRAWQKQGFTEGYDAVMEKAKQGDKDALITILSIFPEDADQHEPLRSLFQQARTDPDFRARCKAVPRTVKIHQSMLKNMDLLVYLSLHIHLVEAHRDRTMDLQDIVEELDRKGLEPLQYGAFQKFLKRHFKDIYQTAETIENMASRG